jgi:hypothetical protein
VADPVVSLPDELQLQIVRFVEGAAQPHAAFCALIGGAVGACSFQLSHRDMAEVLWMLGDRTAERRP